MDDWVRDRRAEKEGNCSVIVEEVRSFEALPGHVGEDMRNVLLEMGAEEEIEGLDEEEVCHCYGNCRSHREG